MEPSYTQLHAHGMHNTIPLCSYWGDTSHSLCSAQDGRNEGHLEQAVLSWWLHHISVIWHQGHQDGNALRKACRSHDHVQCEEQDVSRGWM
jgi:hypothetical protein